MTKARTDSVTIALHPSEKDALIKAAGSLALAPWMRMICLAEASKPSSAPRPTTKEPY